MAILNQKPDPAPEPKLKRRIAPLPADIAPVPQQLHLSDLIPDDHNMNKGTQRGRGLLEKSLTRLGAGRSVLLDKNNRLIAGNKAAEVAGSIGIEDVIVIETDGTKLVAVKRTDLDLDSKQGREMALADNRISEVSYDLDLDELLNIKETFDLPLKEYFYEDELAELLSPPEEAEQSGQSASHCVTCPECGHSFEPDNGTRKRKKGRKGRATA